MRRSFSVESITDFFLLTDRQPPTAGRLFCSCLLLAENNVLRGSKYLNPKASNRHSVVILLIKLFKRLGLVLVENNTARTKADLLMIVIELGTIRKL